MLTTQLNIFPSKKWLLLSEITKPFNWLSPFWPIIDQQEWAAFQSLSQIKVTSPQFPFFTPSQIPGQHNESCQASPFEWSRQPAS